MRRSFVPPMWRDLAGERKLVAPLKYPRLEVEMKRMPLVVMLSLVALVASCAHFDRYDAGTAELWIGGQVQVEQECHSRGVVTATMDSSVLGCTDFATATVISIDDPGVIAHELCHWTRKTVSHEICQVPHRSGSERLGGER
jgi:hypothetical protein